MRAGALVPGQRVDAIVKRRAVYAEQSRRLAHVAMGDLLRGFNVSFFPEAQGGVKIEVAPILNIVQGN